MKSLFPMGVYLILLLIVASLSINLANSDLLEETSIPSMGMVYYDDFRSAISWEDGFEDGDETFPAWDSYYTDSRTSPSRTDISTAEVHGGTRSVKFTYQPDGSEWSRRLGLFITDDTETVYQSGFYWSFWNYIPSGVEDFCEGLSIGGLKWYFFHEAPRTYWSYGCRWRLYKNATGNIRVRLYIQGYMNSGYESPQGGVAFDPDSPVEWTSDINYGAWNHFQVYLKSRTDATGEWQAWVNDNELGHLTSVKSHPNAFLTPTQGPSFFSGDNIFPHPQIMCYGQVDDPAGYYYADDAVIATEKVPEDYVVVGE